MWNLSSISRIVAICSIWSSDETTHFGKIWMKLYKNYTHLAFPAPCVRIRSNVCSAVAQTCLNFGMLEILEATTRFTTRLYTTPYQGRPMFRPCSWTLQFPLRFWDHVYYGTIKLIHSQRTCSTTFNRSHIPTKLHIAWYTLTEPA